MYVLKLVLLSFVLTGCAAMHLSMAKKDLDVQTSTSEAIFLEPVQRDTPRLFLSVRSGVMEFDEAPFRAYIEEELVSNGSAYRLVDAPADADYHLAVSIFNLEVASRSAAELALSGGYGGPSVTETMWAAAEQVKLRHSEELIKVLAATLLVGAIEAAINATVKDTFYVLVTDLEVREAPDGESVVLRESEISQTLGDDAVATTRIEEIVNTVSYRTRIVTTANKANLSLEDARESMFQQMAYAIAGIFAKGSDDEVEPAKTVERLNE